MGNIFATIFFWGVVSFNWAHASEKRELLLEAFSPLYVSKTPDHKYLLIIKDFSTSTPDCLLNDKKLEIKTCLKMNELIKNETDQGLIVLLNKTKIMARSDSPNYYFTFKNTRKMINPRQSQEWLAHPSGELTPFNTGADSLQQLSFLMIEHGQK